MADPTNPASPDELDNGPRPDTVATTGVPATEPRPRKSLLALLASLDPLDEDFPPICDPPPEPVDL